MSINQIIQESIDHQFLTHGRKNLFCANTANHILPDTRSKIENNREELLELDKQNQLDQWIDRMTEQALKTFCQSNQFIDLREVHIVALHSVYEQLWNDLIEELRKNTVDFDSLEQSHLHRLTEWLQSSNPFVKTLNATDLPEILEVVCAEYSARLQLDLLKIDLNTLSSPVLDIGCGEQANLVKYLRTLGFDVLGTDRLADASLSFLVRTNWLEFDYKPQSWGTIIANHSFSLHFLNHHQRSDGDYLAYARKYMEILNSLKPGGVFYYAPALPFIESYLPKDLFQICHHPINDSFGGTRVIRREP